MTEASHVSDLMTRLALSRPDISFQFINNGQELDAYVREREIKRM